jgi:hypothetical protein
MYLTGHPGMALDPYVTSMNPTGHYSMALDLYLTSMYPTGHASMALDSYLTSMYLTGLKLCPGPLLDVNLPHWVP